MEKEVVKIKGNLHLFGVKAYSGLEFGRYLVSEHGISLSYLHCGESVPDGVSIMEVDDFIENYKGRNVEVEGNCEMFSYKLENN